MHSLLIALIAPFYILAPFFSSLLIIVATLSNRTQITLAYDNDNKLINTLTCNFVNYKHVRMRWVYPSIGENNQ